MDKKKGIQGEKKIHVQDPNRMRVQVTEVKDSSMEEIKDMPKGMVRVKTRNRQGLDPEGIPC